MDLSLLIKVFGFGATLIHGDPTVLDRWQWLRRHLPETRDSEKLLELGCGTGAFTIGAALRGYDSVGLSWDERNQRVAAERAALCGAANASFRVQDVRTLHERTEYRGTFDFVVACEVIEHVIDDRKLMRDIARCMKPGGWLLLTAPNRDYVPMVPEHMGPFRNVEDGGHVRKGYSKGMLTELCRSAGLEVEEVAYCAGFLSQKVALLQTQIGRIQRQTAWGVILPLRVLPPLVDRALTPMLRWPYYSVCLRAYKPRFQDGN